MSAPFVGEVGTGACCRLPDGRDWCVPTGRWSWFLSLWWVGLYLWVWLEAAVCLGGLQAVCLLVGGGYVPNLFIVWSGAFQPWWVVPDFSKMAASRGAHANEYSLRPPLSFPHRELQLTPTFPGHLPRPPGRCDPDAYGVPALPWDSVHMKTCVCPPRVESPVPPTTRQVLWSSCTQALWCSMPDAPGAPPPNARLPG